MKEYNTFIKKWEGKILHTDLTEVDYFEVYPLYEIPRRFMQLITDGQKVTVGDQTYEFFSDNYIGYPTNSNFDLSHLINLEVNFEDNKSSIFASPYYLAKGSQRSNEQTCITSADQGGLWCYARRVKGIFNSEEEIAQHIGGLWRKNIIHELEVRGARFQTGIWWPYQMDEVGIYYGMGMDVNNNGILEQRRTDPPFSVIQTDENSNTFTRIEVFVNQRSIRQGPDINLVEFVGDSDYNIQDEAGNSCNPTTYDLTCTISL